MTGSTLPPEPSSHDKTEATEQPLQRQRTSDTALPVFERWIKKWNLLRDGAPIVTPGSFLLPVRINNIAAMLKIAQDEHEIRGCELMAWWNGDGAAQVLARSDNAIVMERAEGTQSLMQMALHGCDDEASRIACGTIARLHAHAASATRLPTLVPLQAWFKELGSAAQENLLLAKSDAAARHLLAKPQDITILHGDIHHDNILDFDQRGWLAIDPKGLHGERGFDYANLIVNPDLPTVTDPVRFERQVHVIAQAAQLPPQRLLYWVLAFAGLSAVWFEQDGDTRGARQDLTVARLAAQSLSISHT